MSAQTTVSINGVLYDVATGLRVETTGQTQTPPEKTRTISVQSPAPTTVHAKTHKSVTLKREYVKRPEPSQRPAHNRTRAMSQKSPMITKFAASKPILNDQSKYHDIAPPKRATASLSPIVTSTHARVISSTARPAPLQATNSRTKKEQLIAEQMAKTPVKATPFKHQKAARTRPKRMQIVLAAFALLIFTGYLTYLNLPGISVRLAASQSGVAATFPNYHPSGYRFVGPVAFDSGEVRLSFKANGGGQHFQIKEQASSWNSQAVLDNYVSIISGGKYATNQARGLTIYTFENNAAWVSGGVFYTIDGTAPLSTDQLLRMAASM